MAGVLGGAVPKLLFAVGLVAGVLALVLTAREEEPQIVVPMIDVRVAAPGLSAQQVERQVTTPLERLLSEISGVEHIYSQSAPGAAGVTLRFYVGEDRETALLNTYNKLHANADRIPATVANWQLKPIEVDDVAIVMLAVWSEDARYSDYELRRMAEEFANLLQTVDNSSQVHVVGGRPRQITLALRAEALAARQTAPSDIVQALQLSNVLRSGGDWLVNNQAIVLEGGDVLREVDALADVVVNIVDGAPVYLQDVVDIIDGPAEPDHYSWIQFPRAQGDINSRHPMVIVSLAKQAGANAVEVARDTHLLIQELEDDVFPPGVRVSVLRDYGATADDKVNNLASSLVFAVLTVVVFIALFLGWRSGLVVGLAVPVCYGLTLALDYVFGYTINRVTLFALILSLGLLVDDPITGVENITRFLKQGVGTTRERVGNAMAEIAGPLVMSTLTIILAFIPLAFISGMMGPYMAPMAFNVPVAVMASTAVAFLVTPWLAYRLLANGEAQTLQEPPPTALYSRVLIPCIVSRRRAKIVLWIVAVLFIAACLLPLMRWVPLKLLPFDNRTEVQVLIDMPEGTSREHTAAVAGRVSQAVTRLPEVDTIAVFVGQPTPYDFNGMVRQYYAREGAHQGELRIVLVDKAQREHQSHAVVLRLRRILEDVDVDGGRLKVIEVPPGPPVMSTLVGEVYADLFTTYADQQLAAMQVQARLEQEPHVVEVDTSIQEPHYRARFIVDKAKAALSGIATADIAETLLIANEGQIAGYLQDERELNPLPLVLRMPIAARSNESQLERLLVRGRPGYTKVATPEGLASAPQPVVALGELGTFEKTEIEQIIYRKDLRRVVYVTAELNGRTPAEVVADVTADQDKTADTTRHWSTRTYLTNGGGASWSLPEGTEVSWSGEGELKITLDVFRDMGLGYLFALVAIFAVLRVQTRSNSLSLIIMSAIPLTVIGIMPGFWLMNHVGERTIAGAPDPVLFTATAMIGMIALAGIVVRNSLILVEFTEQARRQGANVREAVLEAGAVRMRPVLLTAGTTLLGNLVITLDPVFNGLALAIIFGIVASTVFSLLVVPLVYWLVFDDADVRAVETEVV
jgi:multidrug efflux pump subunit AcrB